MASNISVIKERFKWLPSAVIGMLEYYRYPHLEEDWNKPFNGQERRKEIFWNILQSCGPAAIIETGAYRGRTTEYMASTSQLPVYTVEADDRNYGYVKARFRGTNVSVARGDSRSFLRGLVATDGFPSRVFFYLDAHWDRDLPLAEELSIIFDTCSDAVVMIDDFCVPGDPHYYFDDYGSGKVLTADYIAPLVARFGLSLFYPSAPSSEETGKRRGCVVLARQIEIVAKLEALKCLRRWIGEVG